MRIYELLSLASVVLLIVSAVLAWVSLSEPVSIVGMRKNLECVQKLNLLKTSVVVKPFDVKTIRFPASLREEVGELTLFKALILSSIGLRALANASSSVVNEVLHREMHLVPLPLERSKVLFMVLRDVRCVENTEELRIVVVTRSNASFVLCLDEPSVFMDELSIATCVTAKGVGPHVVKLSSVMSTTPLRLMPLIIGGVTLINPNPHPIKVVIDGINIAASCRCVELSYVDLRSATLATLIAALATLGGIPTAILVNRAAKKIRAVRAR